MSTIVSIYEIDEISKPVSVFGDRLKSLVDDLIQTMNEFSGIGIAAPQIGVKERILVIKSGNDNIVMINPMTISLSKDKKVTREGCLSMPGISVDVERHAEATVQYQDVTGHGHTVTLMNFAAIIYQHELDHLERINILDRAGMKSTRDNAKNLAFMNGVA